MQQLIMRVGKSASREQDNSSLSFKRFREDVLKAEAEGDI